MITQKEIELCQEITGLALRINAQGKYSVWAELHGHVHSFEVRITESWRPGGRHLAGWGGCVADESSTYLSSTPPEDRRWMSKRDYIARAVRKLTTMRDNLAAFLEKESV